MLFGSEGHVALDRNPGPVYDTLLLRLIPGDLLSAFPHRQFHTLPSLLESRAAMPNSYPNALRAMQGCRLYHFYNGLWYDPVRRRLTTYCVRGRHANSPGAVGWNLVLSDKVFYSVVSGSPGVA